MTWILNDKISHGIPNSGSTVHRADTNVSDLVKPPVAMWKQWIKQYTTKSGNYNTKYAAD